MFSGTSPTWNTADCERIDPVWLVGDHHGQRAFDAPRRRRADR
jgi:hypothetical protein